MTEVPRGSVASWADLLHAGGRAAPASIEGSRGVHPGDQFGDFVLEGRIGSGGMGQVWRARQVSLGRIVALKLIHPDHLSERSRELFGREARAAARLQHPGIVTVYSAGEVDGVAFIAQELVEGERTLADLLRSAREGTGILRNSFEGTVRFVASLARAAGAAHDRGIVHRDLKPQNVLITLEGEPKVTDFGLARIEGELSLSRTGDVAGTYHYMSPEQALGRRAEIDPRSDVFSLGVILYECLTLTRPFEGDTTHQIVEKITKYEPPDPRAIRSRVPWELAVICRRALEKRRKERFQSAGELAVELERWLAHETIESRAPGALRRVRNWVVRHPTASALVCVAGLAAGLVTQTLWSNAARRARTREVLRLSAQADLDGLVADAARLWPAHPANIEAYEEWLDAARELARDLPDHERTQDRLRARGRATGSGAPEAWRFEDVDDEWWHTVLTRLITGLGALADGETGLMSGGRAPEYGWGVSRRLAAARALEEREASAAWRAAWSEAIASIASAAECPGYRGLALRPQTGLLPIGRDPGSGLWEFAFVQSGEVPERDGNGKLVLEDGAGIVLVLIPGGTFTMGAQKEDPDGPNYDRHAVYDEYPPHVVTVDPFLLSKYEMTGAQLRHLIGAAVPAARDAGAAGLVPFTNISFARADEVVRWLGLELPAEEQWEYACRAGTQTPHYWPAGADPGKYANAAEHTYQGAALDSGAFLTWDDGFADVAPVGSFAPNAFGLHDTLGNVAEWCSDVYAPYSDDAKTRSSFGGVVARDPPLRVYRGGSSLDAPRYVRPAVRYASMTGGRGHSGVRPAARIVR